MVGDVVVCDSLSPVYLDILSVIVCMESRVYNTNTDWIYINKKPE